MQNPSPKNEKSLKTDPHFKAFVRLYAQQKKNFSDLGNALADLCATYGRAPTFMTIQETVACAETQLDQILRVGRGTLLPEFMVSHSFASIRVRHLNIPIPEQQRILDEMIVVRMRSGKELSKRFYDLTLKQARQCIDETGIVPPEKQLPAAVIVPDPKPLKYVISNTGIRYTQGHTSMFVPIELHFQITKEINRRLGDVRTAA